MEIQTLSLVPTQHIRSDDAEPPLCPPPKIIHLEGDYEVISCSPYGEYPGWWYAEMERRSDRSPQNGIVHVVRKIAFRPEIVVHLAVRQFGTTSVLEAS